jgi:hypothetical protein
MQIKRDNIDFTKNLIKGGIAEVIFQQMFIEMDTSIVIPFGYEHSATVLHQFQKQMEQQDKIDLENVRNMPDFLLISQEKKNAILVEVKYRKFKSDIYTAEIAQKICNRWSSTWLFLASSEGFFFGKCSEIIASKGKIDKLSENWVTKERQEQYLNLLIRFIGEN